MSTVIRNLVIKTGVDISKAVSGINTLHGKLGGLGGGFANLSRVAGIAMAAVVTAVTTAAITIGKKSLDAFAGFEKGMNEVYSLMPGISQEAMDKMSDQVLAFSEKFGILTEETIPALYLALSSGVPENNVFEFMEAAIQASKGGVTDLKTTVDGLTSVINAYGADSLSAAEASDYMFQSVKYGKSTFEELARELYNVTPTAAALGVKFSDVTAALATMTASGVPTSVATTQLNQALVQLSKGNMQAAKTFKKITGESFPDFIKGGGSLADAFNIMRDYADDNNLVINDLFRSVEAGMAVLTLTGDKADLFSQNLEYMEEATGSTKLAFDQMNKGISATMDKIKAKMETTLIRIGDELAPAFENTLMGILGMLSGDSGAAEQFAKGARDLFTKAADGIRTAIPILIDMVLDNLPAMVKTGADVVISLADSIIDSLPMIVKTGAEITLQLLEGIIKALPEIIDSVEEIIPDIVATLVYYMPKIIDAGINIIIALVHGIAENMDLIIDAAIQIIPTYVNAILDNLPKIIYVGVQLIIAFVKGIIDNLPKIAEAALGMVEQLRKSIMQGLDNIWQQVSNAVVDLFNGRPINVPVTATVNANGYGGAGRSFSAAGVSGGGRGFNIPQYAEGTAYVPFTGLAMLHRGEAVIPASKNTSMAGNYTLNVNGATDPNQVAYFMAQQLRRAGVIA